MAKATGLNDSCVIDQAVPVQHGVHGADGRQLDQASRVPRSSRLVRRGSTRRSNSADRSTKSCGKKGARIDADGSCRLLFDILCVHAA